MTKHGPDFDNATWSELILSYLQSDFTSFSVNTHPLHLLDYRGTGQGPTVDITYMYWITLLKSEKLWIPMSQEFQITVCRPVSTMYQCLQVFIPNLPFFSYTEINVFGRVLTWGPKSIHRNGSVSICIHRFKQLRNEPLKH